MTDDWAISIAKFAARMSRSAQLQADVELWQAIEAVLATPAGQRVASAVSTVFALAAQQNAPATPASNPASDSTPSSPVIYTRGGRQIPTDGGATS